MWTMYFTSDTHSLAYSSQGTEGYMQLKGVFELHNFCFEPSDHVTVHLNFSISRSCNGSIDDKLEIQFTHSATLAVHFAFLPFSLCLCLFLFSLLFLFLSLSLSLFCAYSLSFSNSRAVLWQFVLA